MLEIKVMSVSQFLQTGSDGAEAELEKMYKGSFDDNLL